MLLAACTRPANLGSPPPTEPNPPPPENRLSAAPRLCSPLPKASPGRGALRLEHAARLPRMQATGSQATAFAINIYNLFFFNAPSTTQHWTVRTQLNQNPSLNLSRACLKLRGVALPQSLRDWCWQQLRGRRPQRSRGDPGTGLLHLLNESWQCEEAVRGRHHHSTRQLTSAPLRQHGA